MTPFAIVRLAAFGTVLLFSLICLGISGNYVSLGTGYSFPGFALAVAILTLVITIPMLVVDMLRKGSVISWVAIELGWVGLLWVLWVATAGLTTSALLFPGGCELDFFYAESESLCRQYSALQGFQWLTWIILFFYFILIIILALMATVKGNSRVWLSPTTDLSFSPPQMNSGQPTGQPVYPGQPPYAVSPAGQPGSPMMQPGGFPGSPGPNYQSPMPTGGGYAAPASPQMGYTQPGQYVAPYGQPMPTNPNAAQV